MQSQNMSKLKNVFMSLQDPSHALFKEKLKEFMANFDKNSDGRIEMSEVRPDNLLLFLFLNKSFYPPSKQ